MSKSPIYDRELEAILPALSEYLPLQMTLDDLPRFRGMFPATGSDLIADRPVHIIDHRIAAHAAGEMTVSVLTRQGRSGKGPCIYFLHGGGMIMGNRFAGASCLVEWALKYDAVCITPEYRLAPEFPAPTGVEDCYAGLVWLAEHAEELELDPERIVICGGSGGGGLAAGVALIARDRGGPHLMGQLLQCPMIDDRNESVSAQEFDGVGVWDTTSNRMAWKAILGCRYGSEDVSPYCAPARTSDYSNLPRTFIDVGGSEVFRDESIEYATNIMRAGGECELHVWGAAFHGFYDIAPHAAVSRACLAAREAWLERLLSV
jgi:acetyl esterase/lipase